ncbi:MAG TPA: hypothetical protein P5511_05955, partial [Candidatus Goldiibacteriota bacterium]|nr:hypothetical protein [Candidatus Goldiibacteriota bacterium]
MENAKRRIDKAVELAILSMAFIIPVLFYTRTNDVFEINKMFVFRLFTVMAAFLWLVKALLDRKVSLARTDLDFPMIGYIVVTLINTFATKNFTVSVFGVYEDYEGILTALNYFLFYYVLVNSLRRKNMTGKLMAVIAAATGIISIYGILQNSGWDFIQWNPETYNPERFFSTLGNPNFLAAYLVEAVPLLFIMFFISSSKSVLVIKPVSFFMALLIPFGLVAFAVRGDVGTTGIAAMLAAEALLLSLVLLPARRIPVYAEKFFLIFILVIAIIVIFLTKSRAGFASLLLTMVFILIYAVLDARDPGNSLFSRNKAWFLVFAVICLAALFVPKVQEAFRAIWD